MGGDYTAAVAVRYALLGLGAAATHLWPLPAAAEPTANIGIWSWMILIIHAEPAARYARRAPKPWSWWMMLYAAQIHALAAAASVIAHPLSPRFQPPPASGEGMDIAIPWVREYSLFDVAAPIVVYAALSALFAWVVGAAARSHWGVVEPEEHLVRIRRRPRAGAASS